MASSRPLFRRFETLLHPYPGAEPLCHRVASILLVALHTIVKHQTLATNFPLLYARLWAHQSGGFLGESTQ